jgi:hypothetical protein
MSVEAKILKAAEWASDSDREEVTGGWNVDRFYRGTSFGRKWLREVLHPLITDAKMDAALESLTASGQLEKNQESYRLPVAAGQNPTRRVRLDYNVGKPGQSMPLMLSATVATLDPSTPHQFQEGFLVVGEDRYYQRTSGEELSGYDGSTITTDYLAKTKQDAQHHADQAADTILLRGDRIWFKAVRNEPRRSKDRS